MGVSRALGRTGEVSLGYWLVCPSGAGLMTEAAQALLDASFLYSDVRAIIAGVRVTTIALAQCWSDADSSMLVQA